MYFLFLRARTYLYTLLRLLFSFSDNYEELDFASRYFAELSLILQSVTLTSCIAVCLCLFKLGIESLHVCFSKYELS